MWWLSNFRGLSPHEQPSKPWEYYLNWTERLITEFYAQGDRERELGLPVTPMLDRSKPTPLPKFQAGFINAIVLPLYKELHRIDGVNVTSPREWPADCVMFLLSVFAQTAGSFCDCPSVLQLQANLTRWNEEMATTSSC
jgi:hypothetical protein